MMDKEFFECRHPVPQPALFFPITVSTSLKWIKMSTRALDQLHYSFLIVKSTNFRL